MGAAHAENGAYVYDLTSAPTTRFLGNSLEVYPNGRTRIRLKLTGELYTHVPPNAKAHNLVIGRTWVDSFGTFSVACPATGVKTILEFKPCGWFSAGRYEFEGACLMQLFLLCCFALHAWGWEGRPLPPLPLLAGMPAAAAAAAARHARAHTPAHST